MTILETNNALLYYNLGKKGLEGPFTSWTDTEWESFLEDINNKKLYHIIYFEHKEHAHSKGMNVYAIDMMSAVEMFESQTGYEAFICTLKTK